MKIIYHHRTQGEEPESIHIGAIVEALTALGHEVRLVGPQPARAGGKPSLLGRIKRAAPRWLFELLQLAYNLPAALRLRREIADFGPDFIYERYALFNFAGVWLARRRGIPLVLEVNTPYAMAWARYYGLRLQRLARWVERRTLQAADHLITVTWAQRELLVQAGIRAERISVCHNAIDPDWFDPQRHADPELRARLGLSGIVVGFVGTMNRWQGMMDFPQVLRAVIGRCPQACFLFVGDGEFRAPLQEFCRAAGYAERVVFTGRMPHARIPPLLAAMDVALLLNSNDYGSPMKIFEYLGMGKAVIAPAVAPVREVLRDGQTGLLIEPGNAGQMAEQILRLTQDEPLRRRLGEAGREYVRQNHTWRANALRILEAYSAVRGGPAQPCAAGAAPEAGA